MSLFSAPCRSRFASRAPWLLSRLMVSLLLASGLAASSAQAGSYTDTQSGGAATIITPAADADGPSLVRVSASPNDRTSNLSGTVQANPKSVPFTDTFTWVPASGQTAATDPPPTCRPPVSWWSRALPPCDTPAFSMATARTAAPSTVACQRQLPRPPRMAGTAHRL